MGGCAGKGGSGDVLDGEVRFDCAAGGRVGVGRDLLGVGGVGGEGEDEAGGEAGEEACGFHGVPFEHAFNQYGIRWCIPGGRTKDAVARIRIFQRCGSRDVLRFIGAIRTGARCASEKQVFRFAQNDNQKSKSKS